MGPTCPELKNQAVGFNMNKIAEAMRKAKLAADNAEFTDSVLEDADSNTKALAAYFASRDGLAQQAKKELSRYFDTKNPKYAMREQTLTEKTASVLPR